MTQWRVYAARLFPGLVVAQALHRFEEFVSGSSDFLPLVPLPKELFLLAGVAWALLLLALVPSIAHRRHWALWIGWAVAVVEILNGATTLLLVPLTGGYVPGAWTAPLVLGFGIAYAAVALLAARKSAAIRESARPPQETRSD